MRDNIFSAKTRVLLDEPLAGHTTLRIGPRARFWIEPYSIDDLRALLKEKKFHNIGCLVIGSGSKLLIKKDIDLAVHLGSPNFKKISIEESEVSAGSGVPLANLIEAASRSNLAGLEPLSGIPATLGGALAMNAGVSWPERQEIGNLVQSLEVLDKNGNIKILKNEDFKFGYRSLNLSEFIIISARLKLERRPNSEIRRSIDKFLAYRRRTQDLSGFSAGCIFKNPCRYSAGRLIDKCGFKGKYIGDAVVSKKHANFIINRGNASASDVCALIKLIQKEVYRKFKVRLKPEIKII